MTVLISEYSDFEVGLYCEFICFFEYIHVPFLILCTLSTPFYLKIRAILLYILIRGVAAAYIILARFVPVLEFDNHFINPQNYIFTK